MLKVNVDGVTNCKLNKVIVKIILEDYRFINCLVR